MYGFNSGAVPQGWSVWSSRGEGGQQGGGGQHNVGYAGGGVFNPEHHRDVAIMQADGRPASLAGSVRGHMSVPDMYGRPLMPSHMGYLQPMGSVYGQQGVAGPSIHALPGWPQHGGLWPVAGMGKRGMEGGPPGVEGKDEEAPKRRRGRPVGSKDRKPRVKRIVATPKATSKTSDEGTGVRKKPWKIILSADEAVEIYQKRPLGDTSAFTCSCRSKELSEQYVVNSKTIRDIWNRITWVKATHKYWTEEEELDYIQGQQAVAQQQGAASQAIASKTVSPWPHAVGYDQELAAHQSRMMMFGGFDRQDMHSELEWFGENSALLPTQIVRSAGKVSSKGGADSGLHGKYSSESSASTGNASSNSASHVHSDDGSSTASSSKNSKPRKSQKLKTNKRREMNDGFASKPSWTECVGDGTQTLNDVVAMRSRGYIPTGQSLDEESRSLRKSGQRSGKSASLRNN